MAPASYGDTLLENIRATRARKKLDQAVVSERMRKLGYTSWHRQTLGKVERGERRLAASELLGLALALETNIPVLLSGPPDDGIELGDRGPIDGKDVTTLAQGRNNGAVRWDDKNDPVFGRGVNSWMGELEDDPARDLV
jgi:transcriptional regulator with XRE-family HTH domain